MYSADEWDWSGGDDGPYIDGEREHDFATFAQARRYAERRDWCVERTYTGYIATPYLSERTIWEPDEYE